MSDRLRARLADLLAVVAIVAGVGWQFAPLLRDPRGQVVGAVGTQWVEGVMWWYWNVATALFHGKNPTHNDWHGYPVGYRHIDIVGNLGDSVLAAPTSWFFEPPLSYNLALIGFSLFTAFAGHACFRAWTGSRVAAVGFALAFLFQPQLRFYLYEGRPTQIVYGWSLLALWAGRRLVEEGGRGAILLTALGWAGAFVSFWFNGVFLGLLLLGLLLRRGRPGLARDVALAVGLTVLFALPWGLPVLGGVAERSDVIGFRLGDKPPYGHMAVFSARPWEFFLPSNPYGMSLPWSLAAAAALGLLLRGRPGRGVGLGLVLLWVLSLGPRLVLDAPTASRPSTTWELPWLWLYQWVPFWFRLSYPYMVFPYVLAGAMLLAGRTRLAALAGLLALGESVARFSPQVPVGAFAIPDFYRELGDRADVHALLEFPLGNGGYRHVYQVVHQKPMLDARGDERSLFHAPGLLELYESTPFLRNLYGWQRGERELQLGEAARAGMVRIGLDYLVLSRQGVEAHPRLRALGWAGVREALVGQLGAPDAEADGLAGFKLRASEAAIAALPAESPRDRIPGVSTDPLVTGPAGREGGSGGAGPASPGPASPGPASPGPAAPGPPTGPPLR